MVGRWRRPEVVAWVAAQNELTRSTLDVPARADWHRRLVALMELPRAAARHAARRPTCSATSARRAPSSSCSPGARPSIPPVSPSSSAIRRRRAPTRRRPSIGTTRRATDAGRRRHQRGRDRATPCCTSSRAPTGRRLAVTAIGSRIRRASSVAWEPDGSGFFYVRYPAGDEYNRTVHHHRLGTDWHDDPVVWDDRPDPQAWPDVDLTPDGRWLIVHVEVGYRPHRTSTSSTADPTGGPR